MDSNHELLVSEATALPTEPQPIGMELIKSRKTQKYNSNGNDPTL